MIPFQDDQTLICIGFISPVPLPSFVIPAFAITEIEKRKRGALGRTSVYVQDLCNGERTTYARVFVDDVTAALPAGTNLTVVSTPFPGEKPPRAPVLASSRDFWRLVGNGNRVFAYANETGEVFAGYRDDLAPFLLERFSQSELTPFRNLELAQFARGRGRSIPGAMENISDVTLGLILDNRKVPEDRISALRNRIQQMVALSSSNEEEGFGFATQ